LSSFNPLPTPLWLSLITDMVIIDMVIADVVIAAISLPVPVPLEAAVANGRRDSETASATSSRWLCQ
jgi:hypothetical protein